MPAWRRSDILEKISVAIAQRREEFARTMALEAGKPLKAARVEVDRAVFTFKIAAEEARRIYGEIVHWIGCPAPKGARPMCGASRAAPLRASRHSTTL